MISRRILIAGAFAGTALVAGGAIAQNQATVGIQTVTTYSADARITAVDPSTRTVSLAFTNGATATRTVSPAVADISARKVGDNVSVGFEDQLTFVLSGPNERVPGSPLSDEFGYPSTSPWYPAEPLVLLLLREQGRLASPHPSVSVLPWYTTTTPEGAGVLNLNGRLGRR